MNDHHLSYITKLREKTLGHTHLSLIRIQKISFDFPSNVEDDYYPIGIKSSR
jgi:hypothetical protein